MKIAVVLLFLLVLFLLHRFQKMNTHLSALEKRKKRTIILKMKKSIYNVKDKDDNVVDVDDEVVKRLISRNTRPGTYDPAKFIL